MTRALKLLAVLLILAAPAAAQRLPGTAVPEHYTLAFEPDLAKETFRGRETIRVTLTEPGTSITLHAAEITFGEVTVDRSRVASGVLSVLYQRMSSGQTPSPIRVVDFQLG